MLTFVTVCTRKEIHLCKKFRNGDYTGFTFSLFIYKVLCGSSLDYVQFAEWNVAISHCMCMRWLKELNEFETVICNFYE